MEKLIKAADLTEEAVKTMFSDHTDQLLEVGIWAIQQRQKKRLAEKAVDQGVKEEVAEVGPGDPTSSPLCDAVCEEVAAYTIVAEALGCNCG